ncbi:MAG: hypothetical protein GX900_02000 [Clostridiaceae bacterium]|nr:hypothetical protein [Clostridiaceae bacterium]
MTQNDNLQNSFDDEVTNAATENAESTTNTQESAFKDTPSPGTYSGYGQSAPVQPAYSPDSGYSQSYSPPYQQPAQPQPQPAYRPSPYDAPAGGSPYAQQGTRGDYQAPVQQGYPAYAQQPYPTYVQQPSYAPYPAEAPAATKAKKIPKPGRPLIFLGAIMLLAICIVGGLLLAWLGVYTLPTEPQLWANIDPEAPHTLPLSFGTPIFNDTHTISFTSPFISQSLRLYADNPSNFFIFFSIACAVIGLVLIFTILFLIWAKRPRFSIVVVILSLITLAGLLLSGGLALGNWIFGAILAAPPLLVLLGGLINLPFRKRHLGGDN